MKRTHYTLQTVLVLMIFMAKALPMMGIFTPVSPNLYPDNMTMTIQLNNGEQTIDTCEVAAFIDGECRGVVTASNGLYYLIVAGEGGGQEVEIRTCLNNAIVTIDRSVVYWNDMNIGTPWEPYIIDVSDYLKGPGKKGDVNGDGAVNVADIAAVISAMASGSTDDSVASADVNGDGRADVADIASIISIMSASARKL